jgi:hypothetical protein
MKYLKYIFESKEDKPLITKSFALDFQDILLEIEDYGSIVTSKSYYDIDNEDWKDIDNFNDLTYNQYSISFYVTKPLAKGSGHSHMDKEIVIDAIECFKRIFELSQEINHTITYREVNRYQSVTNDSEISINKIESLIDKDIVSISITSWSY